MNLSVSTSSVPLIKADAIAILFFEDTQLFSNELSSLARKAPEVKALAESGDFKGVRDTVAVAYPANNFIASRIILIGLGKRAEFTLERGRRAAAQAVRKAQMLKSRSIAITLPDTTLDDGEVAQAIGEGAILGAYKFDKYLSVDPKNPKVTLTSVIVVAEDKTALKAVQEGVRLAGIVGEAANFARDLGNAPSNEIYPETLAARAVAAGKKYGFKTTVFDKRRMQKEKLYGTLAVNQGSTNPPRFIIMELVKNSKAPTVVLVGKGITFDTGGISIKPSGGMGDMKMDMCGAAAVIGTMQAVAQLKLPVNVIGLVPTTENMPSGSAIKPGDIVTYMNGKSAEIDNTDAEGRLILADALCYAAKFKPDAVIDLATLTGACVVALGHVTSGLMGTDDKLKSKIKAAGDRTFERVCELPLYEEYEPLIKSEVADVINSGGRGAGSITAGLFLKKFVNGYPWAHLDIAGTAMLDRANEYSPKGASGVGVRLLVDMLRNWKGN